MRLEIVEGIVNDSSSPMLERSDALIDVNASIEIESRAK
jgi:hypothetical protein